MKRMGIFLATVCCVGIAFATNESGNVFGVWNLAGSPYTIVGNVTIPTGQTLTIQPGVRVQFTGYYKFTVSGNLQAIGTAQDSIYFTCDTTANPIRWHGIRFIGASNFSRLEYSVIEHGRALGSDLDPYGGGIYCEDSSPTISRCTIRYNSANADGGGIFCYQNSAVIISQCIIHNNSSTYGGGVEFDQCSSPPSMINCLIRNNSATSGGGGLLIYGEGSSTVNHCTFYGNSSTSGGGGLDIWDTTPTVRNTIIANSSGAGINFRTGAGGIYSHCAFYQTTNLSGPNIPAGLGNITTTNVNGDPCDQNFNILLDPEFVNVTLSNFHLGDSSSCISAGDPINTVSPDIEGTVRPAPAQSNPDIGAYENLLGLIPGPCELSGSLSGIIGPGICHVVGDISVEADDSLRILPGTTLMFEGSRALVVTGLLLAIGSESDSIYFTCDTLLNAERWRGIRFMWVQADPSRLEYCVIENSHAQGSGHSMFGGGLYALDSSPVLRNCTFRRNTAQVSGGGICASFSHITLDRCLIEQNRCEEGATGGGVTMMGFSSGTITNCRFRENQAYGGGWDLECNQDTSTVIGCEFENHTGRPVSLWSYYGYFTHSTIWGPNAYPWGLLEIQNSTATVSDIVLSAEESVGIAFYNSAMTNLHHCCIQAEEGMRVFFEGGDTTGVPPNFGILSNLNSNGDSCDIYNNIFFNPMFADTANGDFSLLCSSPCIDAGDPSLEWDPDGTRPDIGVFYFPQTSIPLREPEHLTIQYKTSPRRFELNWSPVTENIEGQQISIERYKIQRAYDSEFAGSFTSLASVSDTTFIDSISIAQNSAFFYRVVAVNCGE